MNDTDLRILRLLTEIEQAAPLDARSVIEPLEELRPLLRATLPENAARRLVGVLRKYRRFQALVSAGEALLEAGVEFPFVRCYYAQGLIELERPREALLELKDLLPRLTADEDRSETLGLLGRAHKQRYVQWRADEARATHELNAAVGWYTQAYKLNPAWHGANLVALLHRAERDGIEVQEARKAAVVAQELLNDLGPPTNWRYWDFASAGEACLGRGNYANAATYYGMFVQSADVTPFAVGGAARQLREIWGFVPGNNDGGALLTGLETRLLALQPKAALVSAPAHLVQLRNALDDAKERPSDELQAVLGNDATLPIQAARSLLSLASSVGQVVNRHLFVQGKKSGGTGFLIEGSQLRADWKDRVLLLTNSHVLTANGRDNSVAVEDADVVFHLWNGNEKRTFRVKALLKASPKEDRDFAVAELEPLADDVRQKLRDLVLSPNALGSRDDKPPARVFLVGHPDGRGLELSLSNNQVIDHELREGNPFGRCRIHYAAPTEQGMSGSPVVDAKTLKIVGLHRAYTPNPLREVPDRKSYRANEAIWMASIREACDDVSRP
jgi:hypothetical protein